MKAESPSTSPNRAPTVHNKQKKLTPEQKIASAEKLLDEIILARHNEYGADVIEPMIGEALSLLSKVKGQQALSASLHLQKGSLFGPKSSQPGVTKKQKEKLLKESFKEIGLAHKANPGNLLAEYADVKCKTYTIKNEQKKEAARKAGWEKLLTKDATTFDDNHARSHTLKHTSGTEEAVRFLESLKDQPSFAGDYRLHIALAKTYEELGNLVKAEEAYREAVSLNSKYVAGWCGVYYALFDQAELLESAGKDTEALAKKQEAKTAALNAYKSCKAQNMPLNQHVMTAVVCAVSELGEREEALKYAREEMSLFGENIDTWNSMATALSNTHYTSREAKVADREEAIGYLDKILAEKPKNVDALATKVNALGGIGRIEEALACVNKLRKLMQRDKEAKAEYEALEKGQKEFVDAMLTDTNKELMQMLNGDIVEVDKDLANPATKLLLLDLQQERDGLKATKEKVQKVVFGKDKDIEAVEGIYGTAEQYVKDRAAFNKKVKAETKEAKSSAQDLDSQVEQLMKSDPKGYDFYKGFVIVIEGMYTTGLGAVGQLKVDTDNIAVSTLAQLAGFLPVGGGFVTCLAEHGVAKAKESGLNKKLVKLLDVADPTTFHKLLTKVGLMVTEANKANIASAEDPSHSGVVSFFNNVAKKLRVDCKETFLKTPEKKLGGIEASKFLEAVYQDKLKEGSGDFVEDMSAYLTGAVDTTEAYCTGAMEALGVTGQAVDAF